MQMRTNKTFCLLINIVSVLHLVNGYLKDIAGEGDEWASPFICYAQETFPLPYGYKVMENLYMYDF